MQLPRRERTPARLDVKIEIDVIAMSKLWLWTDSAKGEVSALGMVDEVREEATGAITCLRVTEVFLLKQVCTDAETELDPKAVAELLLELEQAGRDVSKLKLWQHSHGHLSVFVSDQDEATIANLANGEYLLSLVINKRRDTLMRLDQFHPCHLFLSDVQFDIHYPAPDGLADACAAEFKSKVTEGSILSRWKGNGHVKEKIEELQAARERNAITEEDLRDEMNMLSYEDMMDWRDEEMPF